MPLSFSGVVNSCRNRLLTTPTAASDPLFEGVPLVNSAVMIPLLNRNEQAHLLFTMRSMTVATHKGQISFPGGVVEPGDKSFSHTALREANEEIGMPHSSAQVLGYLESTVTGTGFQIVPVVCAISAPPVLMPNPDEVALIFDVSIATLLRPQNRTAALRSINGVAFVDYRFSTDWGVIWGATGRLVHDFMERVICASTSHL